MAKVAFTLGLCAALLAGRGAWAEGEDQAMYPAAQCAAFWLGFNDYAKRSPFLDATPNDMKRADIFRAIALRLAPALKSEIDQTIRDQRDDMALLAEAFIYGHDPQSKKVFETLTEACQRFGASQPEMQGLK